MTLSFLFREFHLTFFLRLFNDDELLVCLFGRIFIFPSILNDWFEQQNILGCRFSLSAIYMCHYSRFLPLTVLLKVSSPFRSSRVLQALRRQPRADFQNHWRCVLFFLVQPPRLGNCAPRTPFSSRRPSAVVSSFLHVGHCIEVWVLARPWLRPTCFFHCGPSFISLVMQNLLWWTSGHSHRKVLKVQ